MKKTIFCVMALCIGFVSALGLCIGALFAPKTVFSENEQPLKIVLDAGHGGIDPGVVGATSGVKESQINLDIVKKTGEKGRYIHARYRNLRRQRQRKINSG